LDKGGNSGGRRGLVEVELRAYLDGSWGRTIKRKRKKKKKMLDK